MPMDPWFTFLLMGLTVWRITHLLSNEDGPFDLVVKLRSRLGQGFFGSLLDCFYCLSLWIALPLAIWNGGSLTELLLHWGALSGFACVLEKGITRLGYNP